MNKLRKDVLEPLESVLCDPEGKAGIRGSDADNAIIDTALDALRAALAEPQSEPVACQWCCGTGKFADHLCRFCAGQGKGSVFAAPQAKQPQPTFRRGDRVRKRSGSQWQGRVVGEYSTALTPDGYAVESEAHPGSVQIYPAKALEDIDE
jgi:dihydrofolate reductase (trimethoprim resistance protein)